MTKVIRPQATKTQTVSAKTAAVVTSALTAGELTTNDAGGAAFNASEREATLSYLMTGGFGATFYVSADNHERRARALFARAAKGDTEWLARAAVYARTNGYMRSMPILALAYLSTATEKKYFQSAFGHIIVTPGDLADFVALTRGDSRVRGSSRTVRRAVGVWLDMMTPYHVIKYGSESQKMSLRDIYRIAHPNLTSNEAKAIATYVVKGTVPTDLPEQLRGYVEFKGATDTIENLLLMVAKYRLPWEVVAGQIGNGDSAERTQVWTEMSKQMPYMALLRNLNNLGRYGVLDNATERQRVLSVLSDAERVRTSKQFPFRFISALRAFDNSDARPHIKSEVTTALKTALNHSVGNMPNLGRTLISLDVSGSMSTNAIGGGRSYSRTSAADPLTAADIGSVFAAAIYLGSENPTLMTFDTSVQDETARLHKGMGVYEIAQAINRQGGGTALSEPIKAALGKLERYDTMVFITDSESWADAMNRSSYSWDRTTAANELLTKYRAAVNADVKVFFLQLIPTTTRQTPQDQPNTFYTFGWSDDVLRYMAYQTNTTQNDAVLATSWE